MIIDRYIFRELLKSQLVVLLVLIAIFAAQTLIRLVSSAAAGETPVGLILTFLLYALPGFVVMLLPLTLYIALIITLGRMCSDSEMVVMRAVGFSSRRIMVIALLLGLVNAMATGYIGMYLMPKAELASLALQKEAGENPEFLPIDSGRFVSFGKYNIYVENVEKSGDRQISNVFVIDAESQNETSITVARNGHLVVDEDGIRWLMLEDGRRYEMPATGSFREGSFSRFKAPLSGNINDINRNRSRLEAMTASELLQCGELRCKVELHWRIAPMLAAIVMCMVAVPLSMVNPRQGRLTRLLPAIVIYAAYYILLIGSRNMVGSGSMPELPGMYTIPALFLLFVALPLNMPKSYLKHDLSLRRFRRKDDAKSD